MSPEQCRAARAWLDWSMDELAKRAHVGNSTVRDFEAGRRTPIQNNLDALVRAFETEGIIFTGQPGGTMGVAGKARGPQPRAIKEESAGSDRQRKKKPARARP